MSLPALSLWDYLASIADHFNRVLHLCVPENGRWTKLFITFGGNSNDHIFFKCMVCYIFFISLNVHEILICEEHVNSYIYEII